MALPTDVAGLAAWWKADAITGLNDNDPVSTWPDSSGNANDLTQTLTARPTWQTNEINGLPVVRYDGTNDFMRRSTAFLAGNDGSIYIVVKQNAQTSTVPNTFLASGDDASDTPFVIVRTSAVAGEQGKPQITTRTAGNVQNRIRADTALGTAAYHIIGFHCTGSVWSIEIDGVVQSLTVEVGSNNGSWYNDVTGRDNVTMGAWDGATVSGHASIDVAELFAFDAVTLSQANKDLMFGYLYTKYFWTRPAVIGAPSQAAQRAGSW